MIKSLFGYFVGIFFISVPMIGVCFEPETKSGEVNSLALLAAIIAYFVGTYLAAKAEEVGAHRFSFGLGYSAACVILVLFGCFMAARFTAFVALAVFITEATNIRDKILKWFGI